jgi:hypothetical protein
VIEVGLAGTHIMNATATNQSEVSSSRIKLAPARKTRKTRTPRVAPVAPKDLGVIDSIIEACKPGTRNRLALVVGLVVGGVVPIGSFLETHLELNLTEGLSLLGHIMTYAVIGGLLFSALTVYSWFERAYANGWKAFGVVLFMETVMTFSGLLGLSLAILCILIFVNAFATACILHKK